jgi:eukaryotic-like serine/threonine-protein kinase
VRSRMIQTISRYEILEIIGQGGMATVYKAYDSRLGRNVAIKVIAGEAQESGRFLKRFQQEARALANLNHENIVQVLDFGEQDTVPFLVMDYLPGGTLKDRLGRQYGWQEVANLLAPVAKALAYAHKHKIIHRDVKPSNILFKLNQQPVLTDFGIAKVLEQDKTTDLTGTGVIGTPQYMSPEQGLGKGVDERTDIYSLGVVFYELLAGKRPFSETTPVGILLQQTRQPLTSPRQHNKEIPIWVEKVIYAALAPKPEDRYPSMQVFAEILERIAHGEKVALPKELVKRSRPRQKRVVWPWVITSLFLILACAGGGIYWFTNGQEFIGTPTKFTILPETATMIVTSPTPKLVLPTSTRTPQPATATLPASTQTATIVPTQQTQVLSLENVANIHMIMEEKTLLGEIHSCTFSQDGKYAAISMSGKPGEIWDLTKTELLRNFTGSNNQPLEVQKVAFSPDNSLVAGLLDYKDVWVWKVADGALVQSFVGKSQNMSFSPDSQKIAISYYEEFSARIWEIASGTQTGQYSQRSKIDHLAFSPDGLQLWINTSLSLNIWRVLDGTQINQLNDINIANGSYTVISPNNELFYSNGRLWNVSDFSLAFTLSDKRDPYPCAVFSTDGGLFAACEGNQVLIWETGNGTLVNTLDIRNQSGVVALVFTSNGKDLWLATSDGTVQSWGIP